MSENPSTTSAGEASVDRRRRTKLRLNSSMIIGGVLILLIVALALVSFIWTPYGPSAVDPVARLRPSSPEHLFGTDRFGRDTLTWIMYGARITLMVGIVAVGIAVLIGTPIGIVAAVFAQYPWGTWLGAVIMRANDILLAFPALLLAIVFAAVYQPGTGPAMVAVGIAAIPGFARVARSGTMQVLGSEYVRAARASNRSVPAIAIVHVLPNIASMVIVQASVAFAISVLAEAGLSFLGLGTQAPVPSWGRMLQESQQFLSTQPELALWPGLFIALAVLGFNLLGDGLRDRFDPKMEARGNG
ncbi:MAG: ABC transporter permease [Brevibacterium sp.]|uniref:ABC transporter permease n=1 Tax=Brevibacterium sp. TaxID=1701 RepID=UPI002649A608|nr:ABC transporter permease [Brevibacterium sp.]MDN5805753.1 ABC transporter permease [Brevibacterium sp.]MDN5834179.1 ABC transporter permease [Brevibacterium sp.]MDN5876181.1 ABC transporter permease [Brevibacterium sp.]MDN5909218.1 ABC transporter permease [Brevibacterium sp.]MDN6133577.1 ABC transporter permease [Brevibacterium sp.]